LKKDQKIPLTAASFHCRMWALRTPRRAALLLLAALMLVVQPSRATGASPCPDFADSITAPAPYDSPFQELSLDELQAIETYLFSVSELDLVPAMGAAEEIGLNTVHTIELLPPPKQAALEYLDASGKAPPRYGKAVLFMGKTKEIMIVKVPAASPTSHTVMGPETAEAAKALWLARPVVDAEYAATEPVTDAAMKTLDKLIVESFGGYKYGLASSSMHVLQSTL
jgi:Copper amine oxidase, N2 domain